MRTNPTPFPPTVMKKLQYLRNQNWPREKGGLENEDNSHKKWRIDCSKPFSNCPKKDPKMAKDDKKVETGAPSMENATKEPEQEGEWMAGNHRLHSPNCSDDWIVEGGKNVISERKTMHEPEQEGEWMAGNHPLHSPIVLKKDPKMAKDDKKVHTGAHSVEILLQKYNENYEEGPRWRRQRRESDYWPKDEPISYDFLELPYNYL